MDAFDDNFEQTEVDPAAEFLAREKDQLAGLEDELEPAALSAPVSQLRLDDNVKEELSGSFEMINNENEQNEYAGFNTSTSPVVREEPERIKLWREEQKTRLEQKDLEEEKKKEELKEQARKELEDWYKHHEEAIAKTKSSNRNAEKQFVAELPDEMEPGTEWERIAKLCDFNPKSAKSSRDVSRLRSIILQLKQNPLPTTKVA
ncbi:clathrin light chain isoform X4 [Bradysia coprophila]|uniref:clathrin light chain isoform X4 n=1 Tax=Bradysia coprophila TaxID=38358 RepID=UPI00187DD634|nr:clathrin light chain isoform X4 [Bradysia coprophila]